MAFQYDSQPIEIQRKQRTPDGFLDVWGVHARVGTMPYPEHGFSAYVPAKTLADAAASLVGQPVTMEHPEDGVTPDNARHVTVGTVLESSFDEPSGESRVRIRLYDAAAIAAVEADECAELSPGYDVSWRDATDAERTAHGAEKVQAGRNYNHLALTEAARGGPKTRLNIDSTKGAKTMADKAKATDAEPGEQPEAMDAGKMLADMKAMMDGMKAMYDRMFPPNAAEAKDAEKPAGEMKDAEKPVLPSMDSLLASHMKAMDAARAVGIDPTAYGAKTEELQRAVAAELVGEAAKTAPAASLPLLMDAALSRGARPTTISDLYDPSQRKPTGKTGDSDPGAYTPGRLSPEDAYAANLDRAARGLSTTKV